MRIRRVVTGHSGEGKARVIIDEVSTDVVSFRPGATVCNLWSTDSLPADNQVEGDGAKRIRGTAHPEGSVFRIIEFAPGVAPRNHRTASLDYAVVLSGEIDMELDGEVVRLRAGDALVQRGTIHNWINRGDSPCVIAFVLIGAVPVRIAGTPLEPKG
ncbi:MAG TPA: cupin domain-containing protein [Stellaceae bacterium]|nr:cupin domain-containing protein [Stellaceae bacterium]